MDTAISTSSSPTASGHGATGARRRQGQTRRGSSSQLVLGNRRGSACTPLQLPRSIDPQGSDIQDTSPLHALASLRFLVLSYLADLEHRLTQFEFQFDFDFDLELDFESKSKALEAWKLQGEHKLREAKARARTGIEMLKGIRADVCSHFPEFPTEGLANFKSCLPDVSAMSIPDVPTLEDMRSNLPDIRSHLPDITTLPDMSLPESMRAHLPDMSLSETVRAHLPDMSIHMHMPTLPDLHIRDFQTGMDDVLSEMRHKLSEVDFHRPFKYIPTLSQSLENLHYHLSSMTTTDTQEPLDLPKSLAFEFPPNNVLSDLLESLLNSDIVKELLESAPEIIEEGEEMLERAAIEVSDALKSSLHGMKLVNYSDLPHAWRNSPFVTYGYRFVVSRYSLSSFLIKSQVYTYRAMATHY
jgi:adiponectin receptor